VAAGQALFGFTDMDNAFNVESMSMNAVEASNAPLTPLNGMNRLPEAVILSYTFCPVRHG
jgi:hypothetical protein